MAYDLIEHYKSYYLALKRLFTSMCPKRTHKYDQFKLESLISNWNIFHDYVHLFTLHVPRGPFWRKSLLDNIDIDEVWALSEPVCGDHLTPNLLWMQSHILLQYRLLLKHSLIQIKPYMLNIFKIVYQQYTLPVHR